MRRSITCKLLSCTARVAKNRLRKGALMTTSIRPSAMHYSRSCLRLASASGPGARYFRALTARERPRRAGSPNRPGAARTSALRRHSKNVRYTIYPRSPARARLCFSVQRRGSCDVQMLRFLFSGSIVTTQSQAWSVCRRRLVVGGSVPKPRASAAHRPARTT